MAKFDWSSSQRDAIFTRQRDNGERCNLLVSAAAGSGKTAVLVQRITEKLIPTDYSESIDANRLLVVTFTNAAAHEMAERIKKSLEDALIEARKNGDYERCNLIREQQLLIPESDITTIDAFCLRLIRKHFNILDISPDFMIADEAQNELMADETMNELFSELYEENSEAFSDLLYMYASNSNDSGLQLLIRQIYDFLIKLPEPFRWYEEKAQELLLEGGLDNNVCYKNMQKISEQKLSQSFALVKKALSYIFGSDDIDFNISQNPLEEGCPIFEHWKKYYELFYIYYNELKPLLSASKEAQGRFLSSFTRPRFANNPALTDEDIQYLQSLNNQIKANLSVATNYLAINKDAFTKLSREKLYPTVCALGSIAKRFFYKFYEKKRAKNVFSFADIEMLAYKLLSENADISAQLKAKYEEVLMDEYQDTSVLQEAIFSFITDGSNLFTVGDMKQSIYRFRSSDPTIFKARLERSSFDTQSIDRKIFLSENFRSREDVLEGINDIFTAVMSETAGEIDYDEQQRLNAKNPNYSDTGFDFKSECVIIDPQTDTLYGDEDDDGEHENLSQITLEARYIASEIARLKAEHFKVHDGSNVRDIQNRDIVILMSSYKAAADIFTEELNSFGIDCFAERNGYFEKNEIRLMMSLLKTIGNPYSDIPLLSVLRSPIASFDDNELVVIRKCKSGKFFGAIKEFIRLKNEGLISNSADMITAEKAERFYESLKRWRAYSRYMPSDKLVWTLYEETDFYAFCGALYGGAEAQANLRLLFERAKQYEAYGFRGLFGFVKYLERVKKKKKDLSTAKIIGENNDIVRIMTIHHSKGLEFPVVFIAGGGKRFIKKLDNSKFIMHNECGITLDYINFKDKYTVPSPLKEYFRSIFFKEQTSEEIRKLYVAMTRAKEKLYFVATTKKPPSQELIDGKFPPDYILSSYHFSDWVIPVAESSENWHIKRLSYDAISASLKPEPEETKTEAKEFDIEGILDFEYPYAEATVLPSKVSVSELKATGQTAVIPAPAFLSEKALSGANYGTAVHSVMENLTPKKDMDSEYVKAEISRLVSAGKMDKDSAELIRPDIILKFYRSEIGKRILESPEVLREQAFEILAPTNIIYPDSFTAVDEKIILQGVIDCWFTEGDGIILLDYKTDSFSDTTEIHEKYDRQLELYTYAIEKITGKKVKEKYIYLFYNGTVLPC